MNILRVLTREPFYQPLSEARKVTDYQFWEVFVKPELLKHRRQQRDRGDDYESGRSWKQPKRMPTKEEYVELGMRLGGKADELGAGYDSWLSKQPTKKGSGDGRS